MRNLHSFVVGEGEIKILWYPPDIPCPGCGFEMFWDEKDNQKIVFCPPERPGLVGINTCEFAGQVFCISPATFYLTRIYLLSDSEIAFLKQQSPEILAEWSVKLNKWEWVSELGEPEPLPTKKSDGRFHLEGTKRDAIVTWIEKNIDSKLISRAWHKSMTDEEFENFWERRGKKEWVTEQET